MIPDLVPIGGPSAAGDIHHGQAVAFALRRENVHQQASTMNFAENHIFGLRVGRVLLGVGGDGKKQADEQTAPDKSGGVLHSRA